LSLQPSTSVLGLGRKINLSPVRTTARVPVLQRRHKLWSALKRLRAPAALRDYGENALISLVPSTEVLGCTLNVPPGRMKNPNDKDQLLNGT
jgi:hypothetical protein